MLAERPEVGAGKWGARRWPKLSFSTCKFLLENEVSTVLTEFWKMQEAPVFWNLLDTKNAAGEAYLKETEGLVMEPEPGSIWWEAWLPRNPLKYSRTYETTKLSRSWKQTVVKYFGWLPNPILSIGNWKGKDKPERKWRPVVVPAPGSMWWEAWRPRDSRRKKIEKN